MFPFMEMKEETESGEEVRERYALRPMNCPHHHKVFAARLRSYRDLPLRLAEYGQVYRYEDSGALSGLLRVRGMCMNDAHIYCTEDQIKAEFLEVMQMHRDLYEILGMSNYVPALLDLGSRGSEGQGEVRRRSRGVGAHRSATCTRPWSTAACPSRRARARRPSTGPRSTCSSGR